MVELGCSVELIQAVIDLGNADDYLIYSLTLDGKAVKEFVQKNAPDKMDRLKSVVDNNQYKITAYDW
jgi:hypothetical protein